MLAELDITLWEAVWMIEAETKDLRSMNLENGFSPVMSGSACKGLPDDYEAELFTIN